MPPTFVNFVRRFVYNGSMDNQTTERQIFSVSELNRSVRNLLENQFPLLWVEGEISNFARPSSGHWYLTLKDEKAQVRCAMFKNANSRVNFTPSNGLSVLVRCRVGLYEGRGEYQLVIEHMEEAGFGALQRKFDQLKLLLATEGLFERAHKKILPTNASHIGVITSPTGAAITDILSVLKRRFPAIKVSIFPAAVQGEQAAAQIVQAIEDANQHNQCDALIVGRGGGSLEDLWPFNEEAVARAIFHSDLPIVSAVGHEIDFTIADFVADVRAPTPSAAAELLSPDYLDMQRQIVDRIKLLQQALLRKITQLSSHRGHLEKRLQHPSRKLMEQMQNLDHLETRLNQAIRVTMQQQNTQFSVLVEKLIGRNSKPLVSQYCERLVSGVQALQQAAGKKLYTAQTKIDQTLHLLDAVSPLKVLDRGFSVIRNSKGQAVKSVTTVEVGENLIARLTDGELQVTTKDIRKIDK